MILFCHLIKDLVLFPLILFAFLSFDHNTHLTLVVSNYCLVLYSFI